MENNYKNKIKIANHELIENGNLNIIEEIFHNDYISHAGGKDYKGHKFIKRWVKQLRSAIPNIRVVNVEFFVSTENILVWQRTLSGKHTVEMWGLIPSNKKIVWREMVVSRFEDNKIIEEFVNSELVGELLLKTH